MSDPGARAMQALSDTVRRILEARVEPMRDYPLDFNTDDPNAPPYYAEAFRAGGRPPWPLGGAYGSEFAGGWMDLRLAHAPGRPDLAPRPEVDHPQGPQPRRWTNGGAMGGGPSRWQDSRNWSGAVLHARDGERFSAICGRWRVPGVRESPSVPPPVPGPSSEDPLSRRVSVWVGLDGHRLVAGSLPQVGTTTAECFQGGRRWVETYAWAQWWVRGAQFGEVVLQDFKVAPGDEVTCWLALHEPDRVTLCLRNHATGQETGTIWRSGPAPDPRATEVHPTATPVAGMGAAWVVERPTVMGRTDLYPLPDFDRVEFTGCFAGARGVAAPFHEVALRDLTGCRLIRMLDRRMDPPATRRIARPELPRDTPSALTVRHCG